MSKNARMFATAVAVATASVLPIPAPAQQDDAEKQFGIVHFETSCNETAQRRFDRAMRYQHSFWYQSSKEIFEETLKADPECGIAYWGIALSLLLNPHVPTPAKNLAEGAAAIAQAKSVGAKTQRERDFIDALAVIYADHENAYCENAGPIVSHYNNQYDAVAGFAAQFMRRDRPTVLVLVFLPMIRMPFRKR